MPLWLQYGYQLSIVCGKEPFRRALPEELCCDQWSWPTGHTRSHVRTTPDLPLHPIIDKEEDIKVHPLPLSFLSLLFSSRSLLSYFSPSYPPFSPFSLPRYVKVLRPGHYYLTLAKDKRVKPGRIGLSGVQVNISVFVPSFLHPSLSHLAITSSSWICICGLTAI